MKKGPFGFSRAQKHHRRVGMSLNAQLTSRCRHSLHTSPPAAAVALSRIITARVAALLHRRVLPLYHHSVLSAGPQRPVARPADSHRAFPAAALSSFSLCVNAGRQPSAFSTYALSQIHGWSSTVNTGGSCADGGYGRHTDAGAGAETKSVDIIPIMHVHPV